MGRIQEVNMADFELTPEAVMEETHVVTEHVRNQLEEVEAAAAAISAEPMIDLEAEEKPVENSLSKFTPDEQRQIKAVAEKMRAVFEAMTNAVAHRDYSMPGSKVRLRLFADRLEIYTPGMLVNTMKPEDFPFLHFTVLRPAQSTLSFLTHAPFLRISPSLSFAELLWLPFSIL